MPRHTPFVLLLALAACVDVGVRTHEHGHTDGVLQGVDHADTDCGDSEGDDPIDTDSNETGTHPIDTDDDGVAETGFHSPAPPIRYCVDHWDAPRCTPSADCAHVDGQKHVLCTVPCGEQGPACLIPCDDATPCPEGTQCSPPLSPDDIWTCPS